MPLTCDAWHLEFCRRGRDVRIETGSGGGDQIDRHRHVWIFCLQGSRILFDAGDQELVRRPKVRAAGTGGIVAIACGRGPRVEIAGSGKWLPDDARADDLAVARDELSVGLAGKDQLRQTR